MTLNRLSPIPTRAPIPTRGPFPTRALGTVLLLAVAACPGREVAEVDPIPEPVPDKTIPVNINRNIDILFVIDDSGSMREEQTSLANNFVNFINVLNNIEGGLPNVHIGVASTNTGAIQGVQGCEASGDNGVLQNDARVAGCNAPSDLYISDIEGTANYAGGNLAETFSCIAQLGIQGCGFETPLEAMKRALDPATGENGGFIRDDAFLAVIFITDEDDCSVTQDARAEFFSSPNAGVNDALGPFSSFRCFDFGIECSPDDPRSNGGKEECLPREDSPYIEPVGNYVKFLVDRKPPGQVIVAGIFGLPEDSPGGGGFRASVIPNDSNGQLAGTPSLGPACVSSSGDAAPGIRLKQFVDAFVQSRTTTICNADLSDALASIADLLAEVIGTPCLSNNVILPPDCVGWLEDDDPESDDILLSECGGAAETGCYAFLNDLAECATPDAGDTELGVEYRPSGQEPFGTKFRLQCVGDAL